MRFETISLARRTMTMKSILTTMNRYKNETNNKTRKQCSRIIGFYVYGWTDFDRKKILKRESSVTREVTIQEEYRTQYGTKSRKIEAISTCGRIKDRHSNVDGPARMIIHTTAPFMMDLFMLETDLGAWQGINVMIDIRERVVGSILVQLGDLSRKCTNEVRSHQLEDRW
jgi:hypothetical protein